jgi:hypothetical protein
MRDDVPRCVMIAIGYSRKKRKKKKLIPKTSISLLLLLFLLKNTKTKQVQLSARTYPSRDSRKEKTTTLPLFARLFFFFFLKFLVRPKDSRPKDKKNSDSLSPAAAEQ